MIVMLVIANGSQAFLAQSYQPDPHSSRGRRGPAAKPAKFTNDVTKAWDMSYGKDAPQNPEYGPEWLAQTMAAHYGITNWMLLTVRS
jgi:hypothetical protein